MKSQNMIPHDDDMRRSCKQLSDRELLDYSDSISVALGKSATSLMQKKQIVSLNQMLSSERAKRKEMENTL